MQYAPRSLLVRVARMVLVFTPTTSSLRVRASSCGADVRFPTICGRRSVTRIVSYVDLLPTRSHQRIRLLHVELGVTRVSSHVLKQRRGAGAGRGRRSGRWRSISFTQLVYHENNMQRVLKASFTFLAVFLASSILSACETYNGGTLCEDVVPFQQASGQRTHLRKSDL
jgi:hypothetical protein